MHERSFVHSLQPQCKVVSALLFSLLVVATPPQELWAFGAFAFCLFIVARVARVRVGLVLRRLVVEVPFLLFALLLPFTAGGEETDVLGMVVSRDGLLAAWNIAIKATLGLSATVLLAATTPAPQILHGLERLRMPRIFTAIAHFMIRYADVVAGEMKRMKIAREARGYEPGFLWQARALASSMGTLFIRSYERGERVYLAMVSRGYTGSIPVVAGEGAGARAWMQALSLPLAAAVVAAVSRFGT